MKINQTASLSRVEYAALQTLIEDCSTVFGFDAKPFNAEEAITITTKVKTSMMNFLYLLNATDEVVVEITIDIDPEVIVQLAEITTDYLPNIKGLLGLFTGYGRIISQLTDDAEVEEEITSNQVNGTSD